MALTEAADIEGEGYDDHANFLRRRFMAAHEAVGRTTNDLCAAQAANAAAIAEQVAVVTEMRQQGIDTSLLESVLYQPAEEPYDGPDYID